MSSNIIETAFIAETQNFPEDPLEIEALRLCDDPLRIWTRRAHRDLVPVSSPQARKI